MPCELLMARKGKAAALPYQKRPSYFFSDVLKDGRFVSVISIEAELMQ